MIEELTPPFNTGIRSGKNHFAPIRGRKNSKKTWDLGEAIIKEGRQAGKRGRRCAVKFSEESASPGALSISG